MGRGRAKAKQTRKARELKYSSPGLDADALQRELAGFSHLHDPEPDEFSGNEYSSSYLDDDEDEDDHRR